MINKSTYKTLGSQSSVFWIGSLFVCLLSALCISCSKPKTFAVQGEIDGLTNSTIYFKYYSDYAVHNLPCIVRDGKFEAEFPAPDPAMIEIQDNGGNVLGRLFAVNGDVLNLKISYSNPFTNVVKGNEANERWSKVLADNAQLLKGADSRQVNDVVEKYISENPDDIVSTLMFVSLYTPSFDPVRADSILSLINQDARLSSLLGSYYAQIQRFINPLSYGKVRPIRYRTSDTIAAKTFDPADKEVSLIVLSNESNRIGDSIPYKIRNIYKNSPKKKLQIIDFALYQDTSVWKRVLVRDSAEWIQGWLPGGILGDGLYQLAIPALPYFIVTDSTGVQLYRGQSPDSAENKIKDFIGR